MSTFVNFPCLTVQIRLNSFKNLITKYNPVEFCRQMAALLAVAVLLFPESFLTAEIEEADRVIRA